MTITFDDVQKEVERRDEFDIEVSIEFAHDEKKISESKYLELLCQIRIAKALNQLAIIAENYANFIVNKR